MDHLLEIILFMVRHLEPGNLRSAVKCILIQLSVPTESTGYRCLVIAIPMYHEDPEQSMTKELYPEVARRAGLFGWKSVERDIRTAISKAWAVRELTAWGCFFLMKRKPGNGEFISRISEILDLWLACIKSKDD